MTFSRCRRLNVHRKTGYPSSLYPLANVSPLTTMSWRGKLMYTGNYKKIETNFLPCFISFLHSAILSEGCPLCYTESAGWHIVLSTSDDVVLSISWADNLTQPYFRRAIHLSTDELAKRRTSNWLQVHQYSHLFNSWTERRLFCNSLHKEQSYVLLRPNRCTALSVL